MLFERVQSEMSQRDGARLLGYTWFWSAMMLLAVPFACIYTGVGLDVFSNLWTIWTSPSKLITDYFNIGGLASAFLNAAICGFSCNIIMTATKVRPTSSVLAGYFLVIAHCFYGLNFINMWPPFLGVMLFCYLEKNKLGPSLHLAMFSTALGPFISEFLFRYTLGSNYVFGEVEVSFIGVVLALCFGLLAGFLIPSLLPGTTKTHRGHNLYKAGLAIGLFGCFAYALFFKIFGVETPEAVSYENAVYAAHGNSYILFMDIFFIVVFGATLIYGFITNDKSFKGYTKLLKSSSLDANYPKDFGMPRTFINIGIYGFAILAYYNLVVLLTEGVGFTGATAGVTIAALTFAAAGQNIRSVWPIAAGYVILYLGVFLLSKFVGFQFDWTLSSQGFINGFAFATGLCPFVTDYGKKVGIMAGILNGIICTCTSVLHGGFVLYNGGFAAGLTALILLPILDFYHVKERLNEHGKHSIHKW